MPYTNDDDLAMERLHDDLHAPKSANVGLGLMMLLLCFMLGVLILLTGCNTARGFGALVSGIGQDISDVANGTQDELAKDDEVKE